MKPHTYRLRGGGLNADSLGGLHEISLDVLEMEYPRATALVETQPPSMAYVLTGRSWSH